ncbi:hypothetical protein [Salmonella enterica]|nr:hypothetical protein [Salmonella enterica]
MMNKSLIIFSREWAVTTALATYLAPAYSRRVTAVFGLVPLVRILQEQPHSPVVLGLRPHEHVADLYRLQTLLAGRAVLFVGRCFYWTDYRLPEWLGLVQFRFCSWDAMQDPFSRKITLRRFRQPAAVPEDDNQTEKSESPLISTMTEIQILARANRWLYRKLSACGGLTGYEIRVLWLMTEGLKGNMSSRTLSIHKNNGLYKLGMTKHLLNLFRGVKVRPELQAELPAQEDVAGNSKLLRREAGR